MTNRRLWRFLKHNTHNLFHLNTHPHIFCHWLRNTLPLISPVSLQWAHCSATLIAPSPPQHSPPYNRISIAFLAAVCKRVSVCVCVWLRPSKVIAMATCTWGPLSVLSQSTGHRGHMKKGTGGTAGWRGAVRVAAECSIAWCTRKVDKMIHRGLQGSDNTEWFQETV